MDTLARRYRNLYRHEIDGNLKIVAMLNSVPTERQADPRYSQAVNLAAHLAACRENWLDRIADGGRNQVPWFEESADPGSISARFRAIEARWTIFYELLTDDQLSQEFTFPVVNGGTFSFYIEGQLLQLIGHGNYHRGQIALLVAQLGGEAVDSDYLYWTMSPNGDYRRIE